MKNLHKIINETDYDMKPYQPLFDSFIPYSQKKMGYNKPVTILFLSDKNNMKNPLGKTGFYDPANSIIGVYGDGRHIKDIMRSFSHELVHHSTILKIVEVSLWKNIRQAKGMHKKIRICEKWKRKHTFAATCFLGIGKIIIRKRKLP